jgi:ubiquinone/menaquinone biosynthesis C-methylase UbiE
MALGSLQRRLAQQLGAPSGFLGNLVVNQLNKHNRATIAGAVDALGPAGGATVADIGYGGGVGLQLLLDATGPRGRVHGVEPSTAMIKRATKEYRGPISSGRLVLHQATMDSVPLVDGALSGWISLNTIYFIRELTPSFAELARVLASSGRGVLGMADPDWLDSQRYAQTGFLIRPVEVVLAALGEAGFTTEVTAVRAPGSDVSYNLVVCRHG